MDKRIAPTIIVVIMIFLLLLQAGVIIYAFTQEGLGSFWKAIFVIIPFLFIVAIVAVYIERMREIDDEEKDDLSKY